MATRDEQTATLKTQTGRFKRLLDDVKHYRIELQGFEKKRIQIEEGPQDDESNYKLRHLQNQHDETQFAIQDCISRAEIAINDLHAAIVSYPTEKRSNNQFALALTAYKRADEVNIPFDEDLVAELSSTSA